MNNCLRTCLAAAVVVFASGCFIKNPSYPTSWPQTTGSNDIENQIEGSFLCSGEIILGDGEMWDKKSITDFLFGGENAPTCEYVEIRKVQPDEMEIRFMYSGGENGRRYYRKNRDYRVEGKWIVLKPDVSWDFSAEALGGVREWVTPHLTIDVEQDLIIRGKNRAAGIIWFLTPIPVGGSGTDWGRFRRKP